MNATTTAEHGFDREGNEMSVTETEEKALPGKVILRVPQRRYDEHDWLKKRTERLLPEVAELVERYLPLPATFELVLTTDWRMAWELAALDADGASGALGKLRQLRAVRDWRGLGAARWDWPSHKQPGGRQVVIYLDVDGDGVRLGDEIEWGAVLTEQVMLAALAASPGRARHLGTADELVSTTQKPAPRLDLRRARLGLEFAIARAAADTWRRRRSGVRVLLARADDVLELLDAHAVDRPEVIIREHYSASEPTAGTIADVHDLLSWERGDRTKAYPTGLPIGAERARRLMAAAFADLLALQAEAEGSEELAGFANTATSLAWDLRDFDAAHGTGRGLRAPGDLYWEASGLARPYTRQEWLASGDDQDEAAED